MGVQSIQGNRNIQIQDVERSLIEITYDETPRTVPLEPAHVPAMARSPSLARSVRAHAGVVPYLDRGGFLADLESWIDTESAFAGSVIGGRGGSGKTRLAVELCEGLRGRNWLCGFLSRIADPAMLDALVHAPTARLVVVDYAESRVEQLQLLLPLLEADATAEAPVRVLLLVRAAPSQAKHWPGRLRNQIDTLDAVLDACEVRLLEDAPLQIADRTRLFEAAAAAFAARLDPPAPVPGPPELNGEVFGNPLMIVIAAYLAAHGNAAPPSTRTELLDEVLAHERRYWRESSEAIDGDDVLLERLVALATLTYAENEADAADLLRLLPDLADAPTERRNRLARWIREQYPGPRWWNPLEPDLVGEHLVAECFTDQPESLRTVLGGTHPDAITRPLEVLARAAGDHPDLEATLRPILSGLLEQLCRIAVSQAESAKDRNLLYGNAVTAAGALASALEVVEVEADALSAGLAAVPSQGNMLLNELGVTLTGQQVARRRSDAAASAADRARLALALNNHSNWLDRTGRGVDALGAIEESVSTYRSLAAADPVYLPYLATALNNLCGYAARAGRHEEALEAVEESVEIRRSPAAANVTDQDDDLAGVLNNLSNCLWYAGRYEEGLEAVEESVDAYRQLAADGSALYEMRLAIALSNLSNCLAFLGRHEEALEAIEESVEIRRRLAADKPAAYEADLARALNNLGRCLMESDREAEALEALEESADIFRALAVARPAAHESELAKALANLANCLKRCGRDRDATAVIRELSRLTTSAPEQVTAPTAPRLS